MAFLKESKYYQRESDSGLRNNLRNEESLLLETTLGDTFFVRVADNESLLCHNNIF